MLTRTVAHVDVRVATLAAALCLVSACSSSKTTDGSTTSSAPGPSSTTTAGGPTTTDAAPTSSTAPDVACLPKPAVVAAAKKFAEITKVSLVGGCGLLSAATTLPPGALGSSSVNRAIAICTALTKVAYVGSVYGVSVGGKDGHELAASTKDQHQCI